MIAAGVLPACGAAWHRAVLEIVRHGWWSELPGADRWPPAVWLAVPAAFVALAALSTAATSRVRAFVVVLGVAALVHPWLTLVLFPLAAAVRSWPEPSRLRLPAAAAVLLAVGGVALASGCAAAAPGELRVADVARAFWFALGPAAAALLAIDVLFSRAARRPQGAVLLVLVGVGALLLGGRGNDLPALIGASAIVLWWRVVVGAGHVIGWQPTRASRLGAVVLVALVPFVTAARAREALQPAAGPASADVWRALDSAGSPAAIMTTGGRADTAAVIWRSGRDEPADTIQFIAPEPEAASPHLATSAVLAWESTAREMSMRGMLVAPLTNADGRPSLLWRVLQFESCRPLTSSWVDVGAIAAGGQFAGVFPLPEPNRGALVYLGGAAPIEPQPLEWPSAAVAGFERRTFDRESPDDDAALAEAARRDELPDNAIGSARYVTRLRFDRRATAPSTLPVTLGGVASSAWARLYTRPDERPARQPALCRSSVGLPVAAYSGAPAAVPLDISSPLATGRGWHAPEGSGSDGFRWTASPRAEVLFVAHRAQPLVLTLRAEPATGDWDSAAATVALNGVAARCRSGAPPCDWLLPVEAMRTGLNVLTIGSATVPAPAPDPRQLGLMVRGAVLHRVE